MISAGKDNGNIVISGQGAELLKAKNEAIQLVGSMVRGCGRGKFTVPLHAAGMIADMLANARCVNEETRCVIENQVQAVRAHEKALAQIPGILECQDIPLDFLQIGNIDLDLHQGIAVQCMTLEGLKGFCLFDEQGAGKTVMAIAALITLRDRGDIDGAFIISPKAMVSVWQEEIKKFAPGLDISDITGDKSAKFRQANVHADVYVANFEAVAGVLVSMKGIAQAKRILLIIDESFQVKNPEAIRSEVLKKLRVDCMRAFVLCGTPAPNSPKDIINQFNLADEGYTFAGMPIPEDPDAAESEILTRINSRGAFIRRLKEDVFTDLPHKKFKIVKAEMAPQQAEMYREIREKLCLFLKRMDNTTFRKEYGTYLQQRMGLLQACASPVAVDSTYAHSGECPGKYAKLDELIEQIVNERGEKAIVWSFFREPLDEVVRRYTKYGSAKIDGNTDARERERIVREFQQSDAPKVLAANPAAAGAGLTLTRARTAIYLSFPTQAAHYLQSLDRIHRRGQTEDVDYFLIVCRGTIEEKEIERLSRKEQGQRQLLGDRSETPTLKDALAEIAES